MTDAVSPSTAEAPRRIAMWSGPRNLSTAMMRSWENRDDTEVIDEPLYAWYLAETGLDHPGRDDVIAAGPADLIDAVRACVDAPNPPAAISYQKHMAAHLLPGVDRSWLDQFDHGLLLRDPRRVLASYTRVRETVTLDDIGLPQQLELSGRCSIIIDSADFLVDPEGYSRLICDAFGVDFDAAMLRWPSGPRPSDGVWAAHWYESVEASTSFGPPPSGPPPELPLHLQVVADAAMEIYQALRSRRSTI